ncbi:reprolysin-like metallopeptidase, partial [Modestobacter versicolor]
TAPATEDAPEAPAEAGDTVVGELVQAYADPAPADEDGHEDGHGDGHEDGHGDGHEDGHDDGHDDTLLSWVETAAGDTVRVVTEDVAELPAGATVEVTVGETVPDQAAAEGQEPAREVLAADVLAGPAPDEPTTAQTVAPVNHPVTVVMLQPANAARDSTTLAQVVSAVNGPVGDFWEQQSGGAVRVGVTAAVDWFQGTSTCANPTALWTEAAARAGWTYAAGRHLLVYVPSGATGCSYGLGEVRQDMNSGGRIYVRATATSVIAHELGHNFGLNHSSELQCDRAVEGPLGSACQISAYQDYYDLMGVSWSQVGTLSALQQAQLGVLPAAQRVEVTPDTLAADHLLSPLGGSSGTRAVKLTTAGGVVYWLEYRTAVGRDSWLGTSGNVVGLDQGVVLRRANPGQPDSSLLLDPTPSARASWGGDVRTVITPGSPLVLADGAFTVTVTSQSAGGAVVRVVPGRAPVGSLDTAVLSGVTYSMSGWALDPDAPSVSVPVHVYVDGRGVALTADLARDDVAVARPGAGALHGWSFSTVLPEGGHTICAFAIDVAHGPGNSTLGCRVVTVATRLPRASLDAVSVSGSDITVQGWAMDPDLPTTSGRVHVYVDGRATVVVAAGDRPDVAAAFPGAGAAHGFSSSATVAPGVHSVCVYAIDADTPTRNTPLGCRSVAVHFALPVANWEVLSASGPALTVRGWAVDPDDLTAPVAVHVYVDGRGTAATADGDRPDVAAVLPGAGPAHGFSATVQVSPGPHVVCTYAIDRDLGSRNAPLGCRSISTQVALPLGSADQVTARGTTVSVTGWALDPDTPTTPSTVHLYVDGVGAAVTSELSRPDVAAAFPGVGDAHGFAFSTQVGAGTHTVCSYAIDDLPARNTPLGCRTVTTGP